MNSGLFSLLVKLSAATSNPKHEEFLDEHFSISPKWKLFKQKLRSKSFVNAINEDSRSDEKLKRYSEANSKHIRARGVPTFPVQSETGDKSYTVKYHSDIDRYTCNCGDWIHARSHQTGRAQQDCKHIKKVKAKMPSLDGQSV